MSNVTSSGFKYYMDQLGIDSKSLIVAYDFTNNPSLSTGYVLPTSWSSGCYTGVVNGSLTNFSQISGSGFLNSLNSIDISGKIPNDNFSFLFCYEKTRPGSEILLSSADGSNVTQRSGVTFGINDLNKLYLEYWDPVYGVFSMTSSRNIASKNIVYFNKGFSSFNIGVFDPISSKLEIDSVQIVNNSYSHSDKFRIGNKFNSNSWSNGNGFSGYLDDFYCLSGSFPQDYYGALCSGFYSSYVPPAISGTGTRCETFSILSGSGVILGTGITGYETKITYSTGYVPTGYFESGYRYYAGTGITGYENKFIKNIEDGCGVLNPVYALSPLTGDIYVTGTTGIYTGVTQVVTQTYENINLTGNITGEVFVPVNVTTCSGYTGYYDSSIVIDSGFIFSLGFENIYSIEDCRNIYHIEGYLNTGNIYNNINLKPIYDSNINDYLVSLSHSGSGKNLIFNNGQLLLESGWSSYPDGYLTKYNITGNIFLDGNIIRSNGYNEITDSLIYDNSNNLNIVPTYLPTGFGSGIDFSSIVPSPYSDYSIFLNGIKLLSGDDYFSNKFKFNIPASSVLIKIDNNYASSSVAYITGGNNRISLLNGKFLKNSNRVYLNGLRKVPGDEYLEVSKYNLLSGCITYPSASLLYSTQESEGFWNV